MRRTALRLVGTEADAVKLANSQLWRELEALVRSEDATCCAILAAFGALKMRQLKKFAKSTASVPPLRKQSTTIFTL